MIGICPRPGASHVNAGLALRHHTRRLASAIPKSTPLRTTRFQLCRVNTAFTVISSVPVTLPVRHNAASIRKILDSELTRGLGDRFAMCLMLTAQFCFQPAPCAPLPYCCHAARFSQGPKSSVLALKELPRQDSNLK